MKKIIWPSLFILFISTSAEASKIRTLGRSPRGLLMGDAYTALADDAYTLFYNPALLARHNFFSFYAINPNVSVSNVLGETDRFSNISSDPVEASETFMNYPVHIGLGMTPGVKMGNFGLSAIYNYQTNMLLQNQTTPMFSIDHHFDKGFIAGYAFPLKGEFKKGKGGEHLALGFSVKYLNREGINNTFNLTSTTFMDALSGGDIDTILTSLGQVKGQGWGVDLGLDYAKSMAGGQTLYTSLAILDPYTILHTAENANDFEVQDQPMQVNLGMAYNLNLGVLLDLTFSVDVKNIHQAKTGSGYIDDTKLGIDIGNPLLRVMAGYSSGYYSYGVQADLGIIDVYVGFFDTEVGERAGRVKSRRALIYFSLFEFEFEP